jgi:hypothetical protein
MQWLTSRCMRDSRPLVFFKRRRTFFGRPPDFFCFAALRTFERQAAEVRIWRKALNALGVSTRKPQAA